MGAFRALKVIPLDEKFNVHHHQRPQDKDHNSFYNQVPRNLEIVAGHVCLRHQL